MAVMKITGKEGDTRISWNPDNEDEVGTARRAFLDLVDKGYKAYEMGEDGRGDPLEAFDPDAGDIVMIFPMVGG